MTPDDTPRDAGEDTRERTEHIARAAVAATLRAFVATGAYPVDRRSILALASAVESATPGEVGA